MLTLLCAVLVGAGGGFLGGREYQRRESLRRVRRACRRLRQIAEGRRVRRLVVVPSGREDEK